MTREWRGAGATYDQEVAGSILGQGARLRDDAGQVVHTHVPRPSSLPHGVVKPGTFAMD